MKGIFKNGKLFGIASDDPKARIFQTYLRVATSETAQTLIGFTARTVYWMFVKWNCEGYNNMGVLYSQWSGLNADINLTTQQMGAAAKTGNMPVPVPNMFRKDDVPFCSSANTTAQVSPGANLNIGEAGTLLTDNRFDIALLVWGTSVSGSPAQITQTLYGSGTGWADFVGNEI